MLQSTAPCSKQLHSVGIRGIRGSGACSRCMSTHAPILVLHNTFGSAHGLLCPCKLRYEATPSHRTCTRLVDAWFRSVNCGIGLSTSHAQCTQVHAVTVWCSDHVFPDGPQALISPPPPPPTHATCVHGSHVAYLSDIRMRPAHPACSFSGVTSAGTLCQLLLLFLILLRACAGKFAGAVHWARPACSRGLAVQGAGSCVTHRPCPLPCRLSSLTAACWSPYAGTC